jgi:hypothetical protein
MVKHDRNAFFFLLFLAIQKKNIAFSIPYHPQALSSQQPQPSSFFACILLPLIYGCSLGSHLLAIASQPSSVPHLLTPTNLTPDEG